jgi:6-phosphogluconolactonase
MKAIHFFCLLCFFYNDAFTQVSKTYLFVGTFTDSKPDKGIYIYEFDSSTGTLSLKSTGEGITNPSFLTISKDGKYIYSCTDSRIPNSGTVSAFNFDPKNAKITFINKQSSGGENPAYVSVTNDRSHLFVACYTAGTLTALQTNITNGSIKPLPQNLTFTGHSINATRQEKPHIHAAVLSPDEKFLFAPDLGSDIIRVFKFSSKSSNKPLEEKINLNFRATPGTGPRHFTFHPNRRFAYSIDELSGTVTAFKYKKGKLDSIQKIISYAIHSEDHGSADIHISPDGKFLYSTNRAKDNTIAAYNIDRKTGMLTFIKHESTYGDHPRNFMIDPTGKYVLVANQNTNNIVVFKRDMITGVLTKTGTEISVPRPSCLQMHVY